MKYYQFKYGSKLKKLISYFSDAITILFLPGFLVVFTFFAINIIFKDLILPDATLFYLLIASFIFSVGYLVWYIRLLKGAFIYDDTLEFIDGRFVDKKYKTFDLSNVTSIEWVGNYRKAPYARYESYYGSRGAWVAMLLHVITKRPYSNFMGGNIKDCIQIGYKDEKGTHYIYVSVENDVEFMRDIKEKMMEHGNYNPENDEY